MPIINEYTIQQKLEDCFRYPRSRVVFLFDTRTKLLDALETFGRLQSSVGITGVYQVAVNPSLGEGHIDFVNGSRIDFYRTANVPRSRHYYYDDALWDADLNGDDIGKIADFAGHLIKPAANTTLQDSAKSSTGLRTIVARIRNLSQIYDNQADSAEKRGLRALQR